MHTEWLDFQLTINCEGFCGEPGFIGSRAELRIRIWTVKRLQVTVDPEKAAPEKLPTHLLAHPGE